MHVLEDEHHRRLLADLLQQPHHRAEHLQLRPARRGRPGGRLLTGEVRDQPGQRRVRRPPETEPVGPLGPSPAQGVDERRVRDSPPGQVHAPTDEHERAVPLPPRRRHELLQQPALAHPGLAAEHDRRRPALRGIDKARLQLGQLGVPADEDLAGYRHGAILSWQRSGAYP
nr:hypothetical protein [Dactylosporangium vinaceum]